MIDKKYKTWYITFVDNSLYSKDTVTGNHLDIPIPRIVSQSPKELEIYLDKYLIKMYELII